MYAFLVPWHVGLYLKEKVRMIDGIDYLWLLLAGVNSHFVFVMVASSAHV